ncbi:MAG TPA: ABC transporter substrate-binding protein [Xanthobacteraceae bacterium]|nr:ABC transporter substrate-binding protein [Xanthobacteraceae bacterium]
MKRREILTSGLGLAAAAVARPAIAQSTPELRWRLSSSFPPSLEIIYGAAEVFTKAVAEASDSKFQIQLLPPGEAAEPLQAADAVTGGSVEMCQTASYYYVGKDPTFALATGVPFGPNSRMQNAWMYFGGGIDLMNEFYSKYNIYALPAGNTGCQMGGWFRKELKFPNELNGLKMRIGGFAGRVMQKLGVVPCQFSGSEIYAALEKGALDAAAWVSPYDDEKLGLGTVAPYYFYPAWWSGGAMLHNFINLEKWHSLTPAYQALLQSASEKTNVWMQAKYDAENPAALKRLVGGNVRLKPFPPLILDACLKTSFELYNQLSANNPGFKKVWDSILAFRNDQYLWWQLAEYSYDTYLIQTRTRT